MGNLNRLIYTLVGIWFYHYFSSSSTSNSSNFNSPRLSWFVQAQAHNQLDEPEPKFLAQLSNITVPQGRDISFTCVVNNLGQYRVAWIKSDSKAILGIHTHMVSLNPRLSVTHNGHNTWKLHISHVQLNDSGSYMCQVNTDPMKSQSGYLNVVVPPDILNHPEQNMEEGSSNEGGTIALQCSATGVPPPTVQWRREGARDIILRGESRERQVVKTVEGEKLVLVNVQRTDMGGYLCIASNGVPPSVSKRFDVHVNFAPLVKAVNQLVAAPVEMEVTLECIVEVYPKPLNGWYRNEGNVKLHKSNKYNISEAMVNLYTWHLNLTIRHLTRADFGAYSCSSINALGKHEARIRLQELRLPPKPPTTTPTPLVHTTLKTPRRKQQQQQQQLQNQQHNTKEHQQKQQQQQQLANHNRGLNEVVRNNKDSLTNQAGQENEILASGNINLNANNNNNNNNDINNSKNNNNNNNMLGGASGKIGGLGGGVYGDGVGGEGIGISYDTGNVGLEGYPQYPRNTIYNDKTLKSSKALPSRPPWVFASDSNMLCGQQCMKFLLITALWTFSLL